MTEVALAWLLTKVTAPVVGATKPHHIDGAVAATELTLTLEEIARIERRTSRTPWWAWSPRIARSRCSQKARELLDGAAYAMMTRIHINGSVDGAETHGRTGFPRGQENRGASPRLFQ